MTNSPVIGYNNDLGKYYIKNFVTGQYMSIPEENLHAYEDGDDNSSDTVENPELFPYLNLIESSSKNHQNLLTRDSRISLRAVRDVSIPGKFYLESKTQKVEDKHDEVNKKYYHGFLNPEVKTRQRLDVSEKPVVSNDTVGSFFKVSLVDEKEIHRILTVETYANALRRFLRALKCVIKGNKKVSPALFQTELHKIFLHIQELKNTLNESNLHMLILAREFEILDMTVRFLFYLLISKDIELILTNRKFETSEIIDVLKIICKLIVKLTEDNEPNHLYASQYIRLFIHAIFTKSPLLEACMEAQSYDLKHSLLLLLKEFLIDSDIDALSQLGYQEKIFFDSFDTQSDNSTHLLQLMDYYCRSKAPNLITSLRENFINVYLSNPQRITKVFPKITPKANDTFEITLDRNLSPYNITIDSNSHQEKVEDYLMWTFRLINSIAKVRSRKFQDIVVNYYNKETCEDIINSNSIPSNIKNEVLVTLKIIHTDYAELCCDMTYSKVELVLTYDEIKTCINRYNRDVSKNLNPINKALESSLLEKGCAMRKGSIGADIDNMIVKVLRDAYESLKEEDLDTFGFALQFMKEVLHSEKMLSIRSLYIIHHSLGEVIEKAAGELSIKKNAGLHVKFLLENQKKIFKLLKHVDKQIIMFAAKEVMGEIKREVLRQSSSKDDSPSSPGIKLLSITPIDLEKKTVKSAVKAIVPRWMSKEKLYELADEQGCPIKHTEPKLKEQLWKIIKYGESALGTGAIHLIKSKTNFSSKVIKELSKYSILNEETEVINYITLATSLLELSKVERKLEAKSGSNSGKKEEETIVDTIIENLENIFCTLYDYILHLNDEDPVVDESKAKGVFLKRLQYCKVKSKQEIPFQYKPFCIRVFYQKILKTLHAHEILIPFIQHLYEKTAFQNVDEEKVKFGYTLTMVILRLFAYNKAENQKIISKHPGFSPVYYYDEIISSSIEVNLMFVEICKNNTKMLEHKEGFMFVIISSHFADYFHDFTIKGKPEQADSSACLGFIRSLPLIFSTKSLDGYVNSAEIMTEKFTDLYTFMKNDDRISLKVMLTENRVTNNNDLQKLVSSHEISSSSQNIVLETPIFYYIVKEFLEAETKFALTDAKARVSVLQDFFTFEKITSFLSNGNIEFSFELKRLSLEILENLYFQNTYKNLNIFKNYESFSSCITYLLIDVYGYFRSQKIPLNDEVFKIFKTSYFTTPQSMAYINKYEELLKNTNLSGTICFQYQSFVPFHHLWKEYIMYLLCRFFGCLIYSFKNFMLQEDKKKKKKKDSHDRNIFEVWLALFVKLRNIETDPKYISQLDSALDNATFQSEYSKYRPRQHRKFEQKIDPHEKHAPVKDSLKNFSAFTLKGLLSKRINTIIKRRLNTTEANLNDVVCTLSPDNIYTNRLVSPRLPTTFQKAVTLYSRGQDSFQSDLENILERVYGGRSNYKQSCREVNINDIAIKLGSDSLEDSKEVLEHLIKVLNSQKTPAKDVIFILKLLKKFIRADDKVKDRNGDDDNVDHEGNDQNKKPHSFLWPSIDATELKEIEETQTFLHDLKIVDAISTLLHRYGKNTNVITEILLLSISLLYGGNKTLQDAFYNKFRLDHDNEILGNLNHLLEHQFDSFSLRQKQNISESYAKALETIYSVMKYHKEDFSTKTIEDLTISDEIKRDLILKYSKENQKNLNVDLAFSKGETLICIILFFFQSLCEDHHLKFQEFLRDQLLIGHSRTSNIPEFLKKAYHSYHYNINVANAELGVRILELLIELEQGESKRNVQLLLSKTFINDLCYTLNGYNSDVDLLARGFELNTSHEKFMDLKSKALILLKDLIEKSEQDDINKISSYINNEALVSTFKDNVIAFHKKNGNKFPTKKNLKIEDIWDDNLESAFLVYFILRHLSSDEINNDFTPEIQKTLAEMLHKSVAYKYLTKFFKKYTGCIEIIQKNANSQRLMKVYFPIAVVYDYLDHDTKEAFGKRVDRSSTQTKIADLMDASEEIIRDMYTDYNSRNRLFGLNVNNIYKGLRIISHIFALTITIHNLFHLRYNSRDQDVEYKGTNDKNVQIWLNSFQTLINFNLVILWIQTKLRCSLVSSWSEFCRVNIKKYGPLSPDILIKTKIMLKNKNIPTSEEDPSASSSDSSNKVRLTYEEGVDILELRGPDSDEFLCAKPLIRNKLLYYNTLFILQTSDFTWHLIYLGICIGSIFHPVVAAFQLWDIVVRSDSVNRIVNAVTKNARQFLWTIVLLLVAVYVYSFLGLYFLNDRYHNDTGEMCADAFGCFLASLDQGLRSGGGIADAIQRVPYNPEAKWKYFLDALYDLSFFILIITLLLNMIFGMIIDAFGDLRDENSANNDDKLNICFICGLERPKYEKISNFNRHISEEHNMWHYIAYIVYLQKKHETHCIDMTGTESYVIESYDKEDHSWIPVGRSLTFERKSTRENVEEKSEVDELKLKLNEVLEKVTTQNTDVTNELQELRNGLNKLSNAIMTKDRARANSYTMIPFPNVSVDNGKE